MMNAWKYIKQLKPIDVFAIFAIVFLFFWVSGIWLALEPSHV